MRKSIRLSDCNLTNELHLIKTGHYGLNETVTDSQICKNGRNNCMS